MVAFIPLPMTQYSEQRPLLLAVDCIIFGFDGDDIKLLVIQRAFEPEMAKWSLMDVFGSRRKRSMKPPIAY